ncbi:MAG: FtsX-like permease family protein [Planctomycetes bacterium]|nr:FtsX-like permease family protein [Planctomycetota bacterium]
MIVLRGFAFLFFLLLAAGMVVWQVNHLRLDLAGAWAPAGVAVMMALGGAILTAQGVAFRFQKRLNWSALLTVASLPALPVVSLVAGFLSLLQIRTGNHERIWQVSMTIGALVTLNVLLPLVCGMILMGGNPGLMAGWTGIKFQFFIVVDYFLCRAIVHYFNSGASAFVSLRFLRKRMTSLLAVFAITLGVLVLILVNSVMTGFQTDFREQMRGSLSHLLVRFRSSDIDMRLDQHDQARAEWAEYVRQIEATPEMLLPWQKALEDAVQHYRAQDKDALPDPRDWAESQPPIPPDDPPPDHTAPDQPTGELGDDDAAFLKRLRTGVGLTEFDRSCLRDDGVIVTPKQFYLSRVTEPKREEDRIHTLWYAPLFRAELQHQFELTEQALATHTDPQGSADIEGVSWRVSTKTFVTPKSGSRELPIAELVGVDVERETDISNLGEYVATAELTAFRDQYVLGPLLNLLGATLGWETVESVEALKHQREFMFTEDGKGTGRFPRDMTDTLARRRFTTATGRVRWREFDNVRFHEFSPGQPIYERVREAYKNASRTEDPTELGEILKSCEKDVRAILKPHLKENPTERVEQVNHTGAKIIFQEYLTGYGESVDAIKRFYSLNVGEIKAVISELNEEENPEVALLKDTWEKLNTASEATEAKVKEPGATEAEREAALLDLGAEYLRVYDAAIQHAEDKRFPIAGDLLKSLRAYASNPEDLLPLRKRMSLRLKVPLAYAVENFEAQGDDVARRMQAYRDILPLRTAMRPGESIESYTKRATTPGQRPEPDKPGIILGDALAESALGAGVNVGDSIAVTIPRVFYEDNRLAPRTTEVWFTVTGFFRSGLYDENRGRMYCDFEELTMLLADSEIRYVVGARLADYRHYDGQVESDKLKSDVRDALRDKRVHFLSVGVWEDETRTLLEAVNIERTLIGLIVSFIIVLAGGAIVIIVYQLVNEKVRDIGILKALGHSPWGIRSVFMFNALFIGLFGAILGAGLGIVASEYLNEIEDTVDQLTGIRLFPPDVYFLTYIPSVKGLDLLWLALDVAVPVVMFGFFCGILPSMAAARKDPVEALHYE